MIKNKGERKDKGNVILYRVAMGGHVHLTITPFACSVHV
jgi:hypothetical protein